MPASENAPHDIAGNKICPEMYSCLCRLIPFLMLLMAGNDRLYHEQAKTLLADMLATVPQLKDIRVEP